MIYITQLIFIKEGKEEKFHEFENHAIPLMKKYGGEMLYRLKPTSESFTEINGEQPDEIQIITFRSEQDLKQFLKDDSRLEKIHLKEESIRSVLLIKGEAF